MIKSAPRRDLFPKEFLVDLNATKAAQRCGYSKKTAYSQGQRLLKNAEVQKAIAKIQEKRSERLEITSDMWLRELWCIGHLDPESFLEDDGSVKLIKKMPENSRRAISSIEVTELFDSAEGDQKQAIGLVKKIRMHSKNEALKLIGQHLGFLKERFEIPGIEKALYELSEKFMPKLSPPTGRASQDEIEKCAKRQS